MFFKQFVKLTYLLSQPSKISWRKFFRLLRLKDTITPWFISCTILVFLRGRNFTVIPLRCHDGAVRCDWALSTNRRTSSGRPLFLRNVLTRGTNSSKKPISKKQALFAIRRLWFPNQTLFQKFFSSFTRDIVSVGLLTRATLPTLDRK